MSNQRHVRKALIEFEEPNPHVAKDVLTHSVLVVEEAYPESYHTHQLGIRAAIGTPLTAQQVVEIAEKDTTVKAALADFNAPKDNLLTDFFRRRGL